MAKDTFLYRKSTVNIQGKLVDLALPSVMGVLNITPDSFFKGSRIDSIDDALLRVENFLNQGAQFIDLGAYSSRPGAANISVEEEMQRIIPFVEAIHQRFPEAIISIDTFRASVAKNAIHAGAHMINDISAGSLDNEMFETIAALNVPYIIMHMKGTPQNMQELAEYKNVSIEVSNYFSDKIAALRALGVKDVILDPGFGFSKTIDHNYEMLQHLEDLQIFGLPILVGVSRKGMIHKFLQTSPAEALNGTTVLNTIALMKGANILRVHDVKEAVECVNLVQKMQQQYFN
ncbi:MAG: dihydropteroate synthase [Pedobacter sp.]|nr:MAG: dihydropteroate synthase [Pedobacter sp.]